MTTPPLVVVDAANVVGSQPDGWWRDRLAATTRLRDRLADRAGTGIDGWPHRPPLEVLLITEGKARGIPASPTVTVIDSPGSADDQIVQIVHACQETPCLVITSDRQLRHRVTALGADTLGVTALR